MMDPQEFILGALATLERRSIAGKKRVHKLAILLNEAGLTVDAEFRLHHFGPFSDEVADALEELVVIGNIEENSELVGPYGTFVSVFKLPADASPRPLPSPFRELLQHLDKYSTVELEVASTVQFFRKSGKSEEDAITLTCRMKPSKAVKPVLEKAKSIMAELDSAK